MLKGFEYSIGTHRSVQRLVCRLQQKLLKGVDTNLWPPAAFPQCMETYLLSILDYRKHSCESEPIIHLEGAVIVPCNLEIIFRHMYRPADWTTFGFEYVAPSQPILSYPYYLRDIRIFHAWNSNELGRYIGNGWRLVTALEAVQILLQATDNWQAPWGESGMGSITSLSPGMPIANATRDIPIHFGRDWNRIHTVQASNGCQGTAHHHVALVREEINPLQVPIKNHVGSLRALPVPSHWN